MNSRFYVRKNQRTTRWNQGHTGNITLESELGLLVHSWNLVKGRKSGPLGRTRPTSWYSPKYAQSANKAEVIFLESPIGCRPSLIYSLARLTPQAVSRSQVSFMCKLPDYVPQSQDNQPIGQHDIS